MPKSKPSAAQQLQKAVSLTEQYNGNLRAGMKPPYAAAKVAADAVDQELSKVPGYSLFKELISETVSEKDELTHLRKALAENRKMPKIKSQAPQTEASHSDPFVMLGLITDEQKRAFCTEAVKRNVDPEKFAKDVQGIAEWVADRRKLEANAEFKERANTYLQTAAALAAIGRAMKCEPLERTGRALEQGILIAAGTSSALVALGAGASTANPIGIIAGAIVALILLFAESGPDINNEILKKLYALSDQVHDLRVEIRKQFSAVMKTQVLILEALDEGFSQLTRQLDQGIESLRGDLGARLDSLVSRVDYLLKLQQQAAKETREVKLLAELAAVNNWLNGIPDGPTRSRLPQLAADLSVSATTSVCAATGFLTGRAQWQAWQADRDPATFSQHIYPMSQELGEMIGFLGAYRKDCVKTGTEPAELLVNPRVWFNAALAYTELLTRYPDFDTDRELKRLDNLVAAGMAVKQFAESLADDETFWNELINRYYKAVKIVQENSVQYAAAYSSDKKILQSRAHPEIQLPEHFALNFLTQQPEDTFAHFPGNVSPKLPDGITTIANQATYQGRSAQLVAANPNVELKSGSWQPAWVDGSDQPRAVNKAEALTQTARLQAAIVAGELMPAWLRAARYFDRISFSLGQCETIGGLAAINDFPFTREWGGTLRGDIRKENRTYPDPVLGPRSINPDNENWRLPLVIRIHADTDGTGKVLGNIHLTYEGRWVVESIGGIGTYDGHDLNVVLLVPGNADRFHCTLEAWSSDNEVNTYLRHLVHSVTARWENPEAAEIRLHSSEKISAACEDLIQQSLREYFYAQRRGIAQHLSGDTESAGAKPGEAEYQKFKRSLLELDVITQLIECYLRFSGKDRAHFPKLLNAEMIRSELRQYYRNENPDLARSLSPSLTEAVAQADAKRLSFADIKALETLSLETLGANHPLTLCQLGLNALTRYFLCKAYWAYQFPETQYYSVEEYEIRTMLLREEIFKAETYEWFRELNAEEFNRAKFQIENHSRCFEKLSPEKYAELYLESLRWSLQKSQSSVAIGDAAAQFEVLHNDYEGLITDIGTRTVIKSLLVKRGWISNLALLMRLSETLGECKFDETQNAINLTMWADGFLSLLKLIFHSDSKQAAKLSGNTTNKQIQSINECIAAGEMLQDILSAIRQSHSLYEALFDRYLDSLHKLKQQAETAKSNSEIAAMETAVHSQLTIVERIAFDSAILRAFLDLYCQGQKNTERLSIYDEKQLLDYLRHCHLVGDAAGSSAFAIFEAYCGNVRDLKQAILGEMKTIKPAYVPSVPELDRLLALAEKAIAALQQRAAIEEDQEFKSAQAEKTRRTDNELRNQEAKILKGIKKFERHQTAVVTQPVQAAAAPPVPPSRLRQPTIRPPEAHWRDDFNLISNEGAGNCLFHSAAEFVNGSDHAALRQQTANYIEKNPKEFLGYVPGDTEAEKENALRNYIKNLRIDGTWCDYFEIFILANYILRRPVVIIDKNNARPVIIFNQEQKHVEPIFLSYTLGLHYEALKVKPGKNAADLLLQYAKRARATISASSSQTKKGTSNPALAQAGAKEQMKEEDLDLQRALFFSYAANSIKPGLFSSASRKPTPGAQSAKPRVGSKS